MPDAITIPDLSASGSLTATGSVTVVCESFNSVNISLAGTWVATVFFEGSPDGTNWYQVQALDGNGNSFNNVNAVGQWVVNCGGFHQIRARVGAYTSGTVGIYLNASFGQAIPNIIIQSMPPAKSTDGGSGSLIANGQQNGVITNGCATAIFQISGTWVGTLQFQGTAEDGTTFVPLRAVRLDTNPARGRDIQTTTTTNGTFQVACGGMSSANCKFTAFTSGTAVVTAFAGVGEGVHIPSANRGRNVKCVGLASGFRCVGSVASPQNILSLENGASSAIIVAVRDINLYVDGTAAQTAIFQAKLSRITTQPTGGTTVTKVLSDTGDASDANVVVRSGASADGTNSAITATAGTTLYQSLVPRPQTAVGYYPQTAIELLPDNLQPLDPFLLRAGEYLLLQIVTGTGANNVNTISYVASVAWEEVTFP